MINRYINYLENMDSNLARMFENQREFIKCKKGCAYCCKEGEFPMSELEFIYLMFKYMSLKNEVKDVINEKISNLITKNREKYYECPFLLDNCCSVYEARPIICRTFGLIYYNKKNRCKVPFCVDLGLNYAEAYENDFENKTDSGIQPKAFNIGREVLRSDKIAKEYELYFGEDKSMVDWLREEFK